MSRRTKRAFSFHEAVVFLNRLIAEKPLLPSLIPLILLAWAIERWVFSFSNWVPLAVAVWTTIQYGSYQQRRLVEDLNEKWKRVIRNTSPITALEHCEWLNKLLMEIWPYFINPKFSTRFSSIVEKRLKHQKTKLIEKIELLEFSLGSSPPILGLHGTRWSCSHDLRIMRLGFDWDTADMSILLLAKLAFGGTARIFINSLHVKGDILLMPVLDGKAILYSFVSRPEVKIGVAFGSGGSQSLPAREWPGISSWLDKLLTETLVKTMVEPRRRCLSLPAVDLRKKAVGGIIYVTVVSGSKLSQNSLKGISLRRQLNSSTNGNLEHELVDRALQTFVEVELEELTRRTDVRSGSSPTWNSTFNMVLHDETGIIKFHLYEGTPSNVKYDSLARCEIKMKYVADDSTTFWAIGPDSGVIAKHTEVCGKEVEMVIPFEGVNSGELTVTLVLKEWQFSDASHTLNSFHLNSNQSLYGSSTSLSRTGRKISITVVEGKDLLAKDKPGKYSQYVKMQYGKALQRTRTTPTSTPIWNQKFEFDEIGDGEYLKIKCYNEETFVDDNIGCARVNLEGLVEGSIRDVWVPLERVNSGELRLQIEVVRADDYEGTMDSVIGSVGGWIELVLLEAKDLVAADLRGTSDPFVRVQYGNLKKRTKVMDKTLNPQWNQTLEFPDDGSPLVLHVKDHNALLPTSNIGDCVVEYQRLPPNQMSDKWIPLQGVKRGEIHIQITRKVPEQRKKCSLESEPSLTRARQISSQMKEATNKFCSLMEDRNFEGLSTSLSELESLEDLQEVYMAQLEREQMLLINKVSDLSREVLNRSSLGRRSNN